MHEEYDKQLENVAITLAIILVFVVLAWTNHVHLKNDQIETKTFMMQDYERELDFRGGYIEGVKDYVLHREPITRIPMTTNFDSASRWFLGYRQGYKDMKDHQIQYRMYAPEGGTSIDGSGYEELR